MKLLKIKLFVFLSLILLPSVAFAAILPEESACGGTIGATRACFVALIHNILNYILSFTGAIMVILIVIAAIKYLTSAGNEEKTENAKKSLTGAIIGLFLILGAYLIFSFIYLAASGTLPENAPTP